jgi:VanZ family protein
LVSIPRWARPAAIGWTLLILGACFLPGSEIPNLKVPLIDKWVHFILFGVFAFLWLRAFPSRKLVRLFSIFLIATIFGYGVELLQGALRPWLGRSYSGADAVADAIGGALGVAAFYFYGRRAFR